jgi:hypothetical protein
LQKKTGKGIGFANSDTENFATAIDEILQNNETLKELCSQDKELAEKVTQEVLDFINKAKKEINTSENPFEARTNLCCNSFSKTEKKTLKKNGNRQAVSLKTITARNKLIVISYSEEFKQSFEKSRKERRKEVLKV